MDTWQLQNAKAQLSKVVKKAVTDGPQSITVHGAPTVLVISKKDYDRLTKREVSFIDFMRQSPLVGMKLNIKRDKSLTRNDFDL